MCYDCCSPLPAAQSRAILVDGTHGTNKYKFCLTSVLVIDENNKAIPVAFFIHSRQSEDVLRRFFDTLAEELGADFCPSVAIVDDAIAEINALEGSRWCATHCSVIPTTITAIPSGRARVQSFLPTEKSSDIVCPAD